MNLRDRRSNILDDPLMKWFVAVMDKWRLGVMISEPSHHKLLDT